MMKFIAVLAAVVAVAVALPNPAADPCNQGPSYWCQNNMENGNTCKLPNWDNAKDMICSSQQGGKSGSSPTAPPNMQCAEKSYACANMKECTNGNAAELAQMKIACKVVAVTTPSVPLGGSGSTSACQELSYLCASTANMKACSGGNAAAVAQMQTMCSQTGAGGGKNRRDVDTTSSSLLGGNKCTEGPSFICASTDNANQCGGKAAIAVCKVLGYFKKPTAAPEPTTTQMALGSDPCTEGPEAICASQEMATKCIGANGLEFCQSQGYLTNSAETTPAGGLSRTTEQPQTQMIGGDKCTQGPAYFCKSQAAAQSCGAENYCVQMGLLGAIGTNIKNRRSVPVGSNKCTWGPSYFCASEDNANECGGADILASCVRMGYMSEPTSTTAAPAKFGSNKCTWGPAYFCASKENAQQCGGANGIDYCVNMGYSFEQTSTTAKPTMLGSEKCTEGPAFFCASQENAKQCGSLDYCIAKGMLSKTQKMSLHKAAPEVEAITKPLSDSNGIECSLCTKVIQLLENEISANSTEAEIEQEVEKVCSLLPSILKSPCDDLIQKYAPQIIQDLLNHYTASDICKDIDLCPKSANWVGPLKTVGGKLVN